MPVRASYTAHGIVAAIDCVLQVHRADGDRGWRIAGRRDPGVTDLAGHLIQTVITGRRHNHNPRSHRIFDRAHQRIGLGRLVNRMAQATD